MARYRKKPVVIEAMQFRESFDGSLPIRDFCGRALGRIGEDGDLALRTVDGVALVRDGDWIVKDARGRFRTYRPRDFMAAYEPVIDPS
jgi:hypothetical protein